MKNFILLLFIPVACCLLPVASFPQWSSNPAVNNAICTLSGEQAIPKVATCANGDTYIGYFSSESGNYNVRLQRLDAAGNALWAADGILISSKPQDSWLTDWDMTCDGSNHAILVFNDIRTGNTNVVGYRISPSGSFVWGNDGLQLSNNSAFNAAPKVVATEAGNIVVAWTSDDNIIMQKISAAGVVQWGPAGITLTAAPASLTWPQLLPVGTDDVIMKYFNDTGMPSAPTRHVLAQRYNASGTAVWTTPAAISTAGGISAWTQIFPFINDGSDGFYIAWHDDRDNNQRASSFVQHVSSSGAVLFPANGVEVSNVATMNHYYPAIALPPGSTDIYVFWNEMNTLQSQWGIYGQKVNSAGVVQWATSGMVFIPVSTTDVYPYEARNTNSDVILVYEQYTNAVDGMIKAMRISPTGSQVWSPAQKDVCTVSSQKVHPVVGEFVTNQWIVSWEDDRNGVSDIYAQNLQLDGSLGPPSIGTISGTVSFTGGTANPTQASVYAGGYTATPDATGHYSLQVPAGTYSVIASHPYTTTQTISGVNVNTGQTVPNVNFTLTVVRADMVVKAVNQSSGVTLNNVDVNIDGPEGPYTGTILTDSLVFAHVPYGTYTGTASFGGTFQAAADTLIGEANHELIFPFIILGMPEATAAADLHIVPNPATSQSRVAFNTSAAGTWTFELIDGKGARVARKEITLTAGSQQVPLSGLFPVKPCSGGVFCLRLTGDNGQVFTSKFTWLEK
ncbi:MAG TPA: carboxypeptidase-like regulatory domain-containing protein [Bacteroidales bacterium]|nr:carboxypeptidase-like regulatory domain-containing protein [Bacteroidales bacterium]